jgi:CRISPR-associated protein Csb2
VEAVGVQREPFEGNGDRVELFAQGTRFPKGRLWHVEIRFVEPVRGPLVIGDGRFLGLGVMAPVHMVRALHAFVIESGLSQNPHPADFIRALRRAVMARVQATLGESQTLPPFFSGHEPDGTPAQCEEHPHLAFAFDPDGNRLLVIAPHVIDLRAATPEEERHLETLERALGGLCQLKAGSSGLLTIRPTTVEVQTDPLFAASQNWESATPYRVTRHARGVTAKEAIQIDLRAECLRRGLPRPYDIQILSCSGVPGVGLEGRVLLRFQTAVKGPLLLGKSRYKGGGLFRSYSGTRTAP